MDIPHSSGSDPACTWRARRPGIQISFGPHDPQRYWWENWESIRTETNRNRSADRLTNPIRSRRWCRFSDATECVAAKSRISSWAFRTNICEKKKYNSSNMIALHIPKLYEYMRICQHPSSTYYILWCIFIIIGAIHRRNYANASHHYLVNIHSIILNVIWSALATWNANESLMYVCRSDTTWRVVFTASWTGFLYSTYNIMHV